MDQLKISDTQPNPYSVISELDRLSLSRVLFNELGELNTTNFQTAIVLIHLCINIATHNKMTVTKLLTGTDKPYIWPPKLKLLRDGRISILNTEKPPEVIYSQLIEDCYMGKLHDPTYGALSFYNRIEEDNSDFYRRLWGIYGDALPELEYWPYAIDPIPFLDSRSKGYITEQEEKYWQKLKRKYQETQEKT